MPSLQRFGDINDAGGAVTGIFQTNSFCNGLLIVIQGSIGTSHPPCPDPSIHCAGNWQTTSSISNVFVNNIPVTVTGDFDTCGHVRIGGSSNVIVG